jgi:hypothetical protein
MLLFHPILLKAPWEVSDAEIDLLIQEKINSMGPLGAHELQL